MKRIAGIIAALPREVAPLVKGWKTEKLPGNRTVYLRGDVVVACAGMGPTQVALAVSAARALLPVTELISVGLAGACDPALKVGEVVRPGVVVDRQTGERFLDDRYDRVLVSTSAIMSVAEKERLRVAYDAAAVDMEAATVARLARAHGLKFRAIKVISDTADFNMSGLSGFATEDGQFREGAFALHAAVRPWMWSRVMNLAKNSCRAVEALNDALRAELDYRETWYG
jgi:adenosylhomocysteine nucleosidase